MATTNNNPLSLVMLVLYLQQAAHAPSPQKLIEVHININHFAETLFPAKTKLYFLSGG